MEIKPCPFCGVCVDAYCYTEGDTSQYWLVECHNLDCLAQVKQAETREEAVTLWNTRTKNPTNV